MESSDAKASEMQTLVTIRGNRSERLTGMLEAASEGNREAFGSFYDETSKTVLGYFYRRTASAEVAADLTAETFAAALVSLGSFKSSRGSASAWLFGVARNQLRRYWRRRAVDDRARRAAGIAAPVELDDVSYERIDELQSLHDEIASLRAALDGLSPRLRRALHFRVVEGLSFEEAAERLGCSKSAARVRVSRALTYLRTQLGDDDE